MATESLRPNKSLLDHRFEGYKLSGDQLEAKSINLVSGVNVASLREDLFSLQHVRAFGRPNHLVLDPWQSCEESERVYWVDTNYEVQQATVRGSTVEGIESVFKIPTPEEQTERLNASIVLPSSKFACIGDGHGKLYLVNTEGRTKGSDTRWKLAAVNQFDQPFTILHAIQERDSNNLSCLLLSIIEKDEEVSATKAHTVFLTLVSFSQVNTSGSASLTCESIKRFSGPCAPVYGAIEPGCKAILVASEKPFRLTQGGIAEEKDGKSAEDGLSDTEYTWSQSGDNVTVTFSLPTNTNLEDIQCTIKPAHIEVKLSSEKKLLQGKLYAKVKPDDSTWTVVDNSLEIVLDKVVPEHHWSTVVESDDRGKYIMDGEEAERLNEVHQQLEQYTSDKKNPDPNKADMPFNSQQLEECDQFPEDSEYIMRIDINSGEITHKTCLASHQWLFNTTLTPGSTPVFCLRHDVDGLVWQPKASSDNQETNWEHIGTFNALGFVQASKESRRFSLCAPGMQYAVLCDNTRHVYIYYRNAAGQKTALQQVVTLDNAEDSILGLQASDHRILALTPNSLHVIMVKK
ncbi:predicted protein [Nematostella vectensis]|uniref:NudC domain-containing protein 1 n=1 Tax=Nematostella vectensis TaxID=45351 RepID=A7SHY3_NEMVE|nr:predicted protein [Nematostella vectensis]|eukprot:XP_001628796.1 predicted protein [Nematostella vectensis]